MPETASTAEHDKVREQQRTLYRTAKADPGRRRFHALYDKVYRRHVLERAWERRNRGAAGIDRTTIDDFERYRVSRLHDELAADLKDGGFRPLAARRVWIPRRLKRTTRESKLTVSAIGNNVGSQGWS